MYVVVFRARIRAFDHAYSTTAARLRELAFSDFGCLGFTATSEGDQEIAVSYWPDVEHIVRWKKHLEHQAAQHQGRAAWYREYQVDVAKVERSYAWSLDG
ncbi:antibiotic biosynthesis monooxygenase family protein [Sandaracinus amylolyticus]|uniref:antibiotic biosynthesis monooxygenase family protein n=1 Tax=Sandaracinus amylolyticus TaxID=927083 RepID=UPI001F34EA77|nr:antibiotic biosynthesis monooxygenase [Sandaracinus amylolyticus]UJR85226.1 Hypothetical protein I5071_73060 [Sandaracinus amylolyticus]